MGAAKNGQHNQRDNRRTPSTTAYQTNRGVYTHRFVKIELDTETKSQFKALVETGEFDGLAVDDFLRQGYSVRFSVSDGGKTTICTITCSNVASENNGLMLTGRGADSSIALAVCQFKDTYLCTDGIWATGEINTSGNAGDIG